MSENVVEHEAYDASSGKSIKSNELWTMEQEWNEFA
jgi:hypothetical protein